MAGEDDAVRHEFVIGQAEVSELHPAITTPADHHQRQIGAFLFVLIWIRATLPRVRFDQLMKLGWKVLLPVATLNLLLTAAVVVYR